MEGILKYAGNYLQSEKLVSLGKETSHGAETMLDKIRLRVMAQADLHTILNRLLYVRMMTC